jgi:thiol-disulfide isomerase/thioredoxin
MDKMLLHRRKLLLYLGLGATGAGVATVLGLRSKEAQSANFLNTPSSSADIKTAALPQKMLPEFQGISEWLNGSPLSIASLKNQVVLVQFWTFSCINCQRTLPYIVQWHQKYAAQGLKVIGGMLTITSIGLTCIWPIAKAFCATVILEKGLTIRLSKPFVVF